MEKTCGSCDKQLGFMDGKIIVQDGVICKACWKKAGFNTITDPALGKNYSVSDINKLIQNGGGKAYITQNTRNYGPIVFDNISKKAVIKGLLSSISVDYKDIISAEILEDGNSIQKSGVGGAVAGAVLLGPVGALAGGLMGRKKKNVCESLQIKITTKNNSSNAIFVPFITAQTKIDSLSYKSQSKTCQEVMSTLQVIINENENEIENVSTDSTSSTVADELLKYKQLLDSGAITKEEYNVLKNKLLG